MNWVPYAAVRCGQKIGSGGQAEVYAVHNDPIGYGSPLVFKHYKPSVQQTIDLSALDDLIAAFALLRAGGGQVVSGALAWPLAPVMNGKRLIGILLPLIPDAYFCQLQLPTGRSRQLAEFQRLMNDEAFVQKQGIVLDQFERLKRLEHAAQVIHALHQAGIVVGDLSPKNLLFSIQQAHVHFIDCDSMALRDGRSAILQMETPNWNAPTCHASQETDSYKFALLVLRTLLGHQQLRALPPSPDIVPTLLRKPLRETLTSIQTLKFSDWVEHIREVRRSHQKTQRVAHLLNKIFTTGKEQLRSLKQKLLSVSVLEVSSIILLALLCLHYLYHSEVTVVTGFNVIISK